MVLNKCLPMEYMYALSVLYPLKSKYNVSEIITEKDSKTLADTNIYIYIYIYVYIYIYIYIYSL